jgi:hypothetical protein
MAENQTSKLFSHGQKMPKIFGKKKWDSVNPCGQKISSHFECGWLPLSP